MSARSLVAAALVAFAAVSAFAQCQDPADTKGRFIVRGLELVDTKTKLVWLRCSAGYTPGPQCDSSAVLPAQKFSQDPLGGDALPARGQWRLPTANEWEGMMARGCKYLVNEKLMEVFFDKVWTSTPAGGDRVYLIASGGKRVASPRELDSNDFAQAFFVRTARAEDLSPNTPAPVFTGKPVPPLAEIVSQAPAPTGYTKEQLQKIYTDYLSAEGYRPELTNAGNVLFRREGRPYVIYVDEKDPTFFRITLFVTFEDTSADARSARLDATNFAAEQTKVIKAYMPQGGGVYFSAEMFLVVPGDFKNALPRILRGFDFAFEKYRARLTELGKVTG